MPLSVLANQIVTNSQIIIARIAEATVIIKLCLFPNHSFYLDAIGVTLISNNFFDSKVMLVFPIRIISP